MFSSNLSTEVATINTSLATKSTIASPTFTGVPAAPTATSTTNTTQIATTEFVQTRVSEILDSAPEALNTLNELAAALGDDQNYSATISTLVGDLSSNLGSEITRASAAEASNAGLIVDVSGNLDTLNTTVSNINTNANALTLDVFC